MAQIEDQTDLANFVFSKHEHTQLSHSLKTRHGLDRVVVQIKKYQVGKIPNVGDSLDIIVLIIEQAQSLFTFK